MTQMRITVALIILASSIACSATQVPRTDGLAEATADVRYEVFGMD